MPKLFRFDPHPGCAPTNAVTGLNFSVQLRSPRPLKRHEARFVAGAFSHILKMQDLLASFLQFLGCNRTFRRDASRIFAGFLTRQQPFQSPIKLSMHSLFVAKDLVHILCRRERAVSQEI